MLRSSLFFLFSFALLCSVTAQAKTENGTNIITIDGHVETIATASSKSFNDTKHIFEFADLCFSIVKAFNEPEFDYWGNVQAEVEAVVNQYINAHNMEQVEAFQSDMETLLLRYQNAPVESDNYPDKNEQAATFSTAMITHRFLVMSGDMRFSLILHFEDIASMHLAVVKDAAEIYSSDEKVSLWWMDLDNFLQEYIDYSVVVREELRTFRMDKITCTEDIDSCYVKDGERTCYDTYTVTDEVTGDVDSCKELHGENKCVNHCNNYQTHRSLELDIFEDQKVSPVVGAWKILKEYSSLMVGQISK